MDEVSSPTSRGECSPLFKDSLGKFEEEMEASRKGVPRLTGEEARDEDEDEKDGDRVREEEG